MEFGKVSTNYQKAYGGDLEMHSPIPEDLRAESDDSESFADSDSVDPRALLPIFMSRKAMKQRSPKMYFVPGKKQFYQRIFGGGEVSEPITAEHLLKSLLTF